MTGTIFTKDCCRWGVRFVSILLFGMAAASCSPRAKPVSPSLPSAPAQDYLHREVDLQFASKAELGVILQECAKQAGLVLALDKEVHGELAISLKGSLSDVMSQLCAVAGCEWEIAPGNPGALLVRKPAAAKSS